MAHAGAPMNFVPPRLLGGASAVFWGAMVDKPVIGLVVALLIEAASWLPTRFRFTNQTYLRAWQLGAFLFIVTLASQWVLGKRIVEIYSIVIWAPLFFLPVELAQRYGTEAFIPANTFSFFARRKMLSDIREGRLIDPLMVNTGYPFIILNLITAAQTDNKSWIHFAGLLLITLVSLFCLTRNQRRIVAGSFLTLFIGAWAWIAQTNLINATNLLQGRAQQNERPSTNSDSSKTNIGKLGTIKQSPQIYWRVHFHGNQKVQLLREASYNKYDKTNWRHTPQQEPLSGLITQSEDYDDATPSPSGEPVHIFNYDGLLDLSQTKRVSIRGAVRNRSVLPCPPDTMAIGGLARTVEELALLEGYEDISIENNSLGTVRMTNPNANVVEYIALYGPENRVEKPPFKRHPDDEILQDLTVPANERAAIRQIIFEAGLSHMEPKEAIKTLGLFFQRKFSYTTHLTTPGRSANNATALARFLLLDRKGHCEYFATASALILRELGIPTRYSVGFSVHEPGPKTGDYVLRGTHAHAWCRAYIDGQWIDVDHTPAGWLPMDTASAKKSFPFRDWLQTFKEDFTLWRTQKENQPIILQVFIVIGILTLLWTCFRLYQARLIREQKTAPKTKPVALATLESKMTKILGSRSIGLSLATWATELLGLDPELDQLLPDAIRLHQRLRFDPEGLTPEESDQLRDKLKSIKALLKRKRSRLNEALEERQTGDQTLPTEKSHKSV